MVATASAICSGVAVTAPWPIATDSVSPFCQDCWKRFFFQAVSGINPERSLPISIPVGAPSPNSRA